MPSLKEVRNRIESVKSTEQITNAMKMVAASKLRKSQDAIVKLRPFAKKLGGMIENIQSTLETEADHPYGTHEEGIKRVLIVAISSNKGLCGTFNANVLKKANELISGKYSSFRTKGTLDIICIGRKVHEGFKKQNMPVTAEYNNLYSELSYEHVEPIANMIMQGYVEERWDEITLIYNHFKNASTQYISDEEFLPLSKGSDGEEPLFGVEYLYEPRQEIILQSLIPQSLRIKFYKAILDSFASEHGARMTSMNKATDNAREMLKELKLAYNKARQASITREIIEIVSGAEALKG